MSKIFKVALIGRANVGKSTLFNTLAERKKAIVSDIPGTTRDRNYAQISWNNKEFFIIDTGGVDLVHDKNFEKEVFKQAQVALDEADAIIFVLDVKNGVMPQDKKIALQIRKTGKPVIIAVNKADNLHLKKQTADFYELGLGEPLAVSAANGSGTGDLLDAVVFKLKTLKKKNKKSKSEARAIKIAIIGKPNVGKSSLVNAILGEERVIVSPAPYTTRDSQDISLVYQKENFVLVDTAGIRRQTKISDKLERFSVEQSLNSLHRADVCLLVTDSALSLTAQDQHLAEIIGKEKTSVIILANKWDLIFQKDETTINKFIKYYQNYFPLLDWAPIIFVSALEKQRIHKILDLAKEIYQERFKQLTEEELEKCLQEILSRHAPARGKGVKKPKIYGLTQIGVNPPQFELVKDYGSELHFSYLRFIENQLRSHFGFLGTPIIIKIRKIS